MTRLPSLTGPEVGEVLVLFGFEEVRRRGSHARFRHDDGRVTTVPMHTGDIVGRGLLRKILRDAGLSREDFVTAWRNKR